MGDNIQQEIELEKYSIPENVRKMINRGLNETAGLNQGENLELTSLK